MEDYIFILATLRLLVYIGLVKKKKIPPKVDRSRQVQHNRDRSSRKAIILRIRTYFLMALCIRSHFCQSIQAGGKSRKKTSHTPQRKRGRGIRTRAQNTYEAQPSYMFTHFYAPPPPPLPQFLVNSVKLGVLRLNCLLAESKVLPPRRPTCEMGQGGSGA